MAPLTLLAQQWLTAGSDTAGASRSRLLAFTACQDPVFVPLSLSQSNRHANCKQRYGESLQHRFFLPRLGSEIINEPT